ncbi:hypothetical protein D3C76_1130400 [compost metagenome]
MSSPGTGLQHRANRTSRLSMPLTRIPLVGRFLRSGAGFSSRISEFNSSKLDSSCSLRSFSVALVTICAAVIPPNPTAASMSSISLNAYFLAASINLSSVIQAEGSSPIRFSSRSQLSRPFSTFSSRRSFLNHCLIFARA